MSPYQQELTEYLKSFVVLSDQEMAELMGCAEHRLVKKKEILLDHGQVGQYVWFVRNGYVRFYYFDANGDEITSDFVFAPGFVTAFRSFINHEPSQIVVQAMENMEIIGWNRECLFHLYDRYPAIERIGRVMAEQVFLSMDKHLSAFLNQSPYQRYLWLLKEYPEFIKNIPLVYLASWLGITPETLSRIRRRTMK